MKLPLDWPRINQFPEWTIVHSNRDYIVRNASADTERTYSGESLRRGLPIEVPANAELKLSVGGF